MMTYRMTWNITRIYITGDKPNKLHQFAVLLITVV